MDTIFIIDDEKEICLTLKKVLDSEGYQAKWTTDPEEFLARLHTKNDLGCVLLDLKLGGASGIDYLEKIREVDPHLPIIMITAYETVATAVEAMKRGAFHYLPKPFDNEELKALVAKAVEMRHLYWELQKYKEKETGLIDLELEMGHSGVIQALLKQIRAVAVTDVGVLLTGESGTGKELVAKAIHHYSARRMAPFIPVDCASIPETLIESELFGHEKGAFTGAHAVQKGKVEQADGGTLFLDEVSNIPTNVQAKLLRFLESRSLERLGGGRPIAVNLRVIAATNRELSKLIESGDFREDLYHRLNEFPIPLPSLNERSEDISYLSLKFIHEFESQIGKKFSGITEEAIRVLQSYPWPGNVRELKNIIKRAMVVASEKIEKADLPPEIKTPVAAGIQTELTVLVRKDIPLLQAARLAASYVEKNRIQEALRQTEGRKGEAAELLGIDEKTLYNKLKEYKMT